VASGNHTPFQRGVIKRYYEHQDSLMIQRLGDIVSELFLCTNATKSKRLWNNVRAALLKSGVKQPDVDKLVEARDLESLARMVRELSAGSPAASSERSQRRSERP